jgi:hypothetical protein
MPAPKENAEVQSSGVEAPDSKGRVRTGLSSARRLARIAYRDPEHVSERVTLTGAQELGEPALEWASRVQRERPDVARGVIAEEVRIQTARVARLDGAVAGTPFLIALVPGYLSYLFQEGVMVRRMAALYGSDPRSLETSARSLVLRGVHPTAEAAQAALLKVGDEPFPEKPTTRRPLKLWVRSVYLLLVFGGFVDPPSDDEGDKGDKYAGWRLKAALGFVIGAAIWVTTWVLPVTFMIAMAWGCESHSRSLGRRTMRFYGGESAIAQAEGGDQSAEDRGRTKRELIGGALFVVSIAIPIAFIAYADHVRSSTGVNWLGALGALVAVSLVIAVSVMARRR